MLQEVAMLAKIDEQGRIGWFVLTLLAFLLAWPLGLLMLGFLAATGRLAMFRTMPAGQWFNLRPARGSGFAMWGGSGNAAFDAYRRSELTRLEEEEREFRSFLERLRRARDKEEFDRFMAERGRRPSTEVDAS
jgi:hypothetical protein